MSRRRKSGPNAGKAISGVLAPAQAALPLDIPTREESRFWAKVDQSQPAGCWPWKAACLPNGYGQVHWNGRSVRAHRAAYAIAIGRVPRGKLVLHKCDNPLCCNPHHLVLGTQAQNIREAFERGRLRPLLGLTNAARTHCPAGHPYDGGNLYRRPDGARLCRACRRDTMRRYYDRQRAQLVCA